MEFVLDNNFKECYAIRKQVFIKEQGFSEEGEFDQIDLKSLHITAVENGIAMGCARLYSLNETTYVIGRIAVLEEFRGKNIGTLMISRLEDIAREKGAKTALINAQIKVEKFYNKLGYASYGDIVDDEGTPHIWMKKTL